MYITQFITVAVVHFLALISPGPDFAMITRNSLTHSREIGISTALGLALGMSVHITYSLLGIGLLISRSILLFSIIKYIGAGYLIYIGYKSLTTKSQKNELGGEDTKTNLVSKSITNREAIKIGFLTNVLNPKATLFILAVFTQVFGSHTPLVLELACGLEMVVVTFVWFALIAHVFSHSIVKSKVHRVQHIIEKITGGVLIALGIKVALAAKH